MTPPTRLSELEAWQQFGISTEADRFTRNNFQYWKTLGTQADTNLAEACAIARALEARVKELERSTEICDKWNEQLRKERDAALAERDEYKMAHAEAERDLAALRAALEMRNGCRHWEDTPSHCETHGRRMSACLKEADKALSGAASAPCCQACPNCQCSECGLTVHKPAAVSPECAGTVRPFLTIRGLEQVPSHCPSCALGWKGNCTNNRHCPGCPKGVR